jgi:hypothetical protein
LAFARTGKSYSSLGITERRAGFVAIHPMNRGVVPPQGQLFWVRATDIVEACTDTSPQIDGCPCSGGE